MLDDLRKSTGEAGYGETDETDFPVYAGPEASDRKFLGMTAVERMFLALFVLLDVIVLGAALLLFTGRLVI